MKTEKRDPRNRYRRVMELALIVSLFMHIGIMQGIKKMPENTDPIDSHRIGPVVLNDVVPIKPEKGSVEPARPTVPVPAEADELCDPTETEIWDPALLAGETGIPKMPEPDPINEPWIMVPDVYPKPIGGLKVSYPELQRKAGIEGQVVVHAYIDATGRVVRTEVVKHVMGLDDAAVNAIMSVKWTPAEQQGRKVAVRVSVPVNFRLN